MTKPQLLSSSEHTTSPIQEDEVLSTNVLSRLQEVTKHLEKIDAQLTKNNKHLENIEGLICSKMNSSAANKTSSLVKRLFWPRLGNLNQSPPCQLLLDDSYFKTSPPPKAPKISLVTPSFRQGAFIERTILSILHQDYPNLEYIVQDGGSTDDTVAHLKKYEHRLTSWVSEKDGGQTNAINRGFAKTDGEIMGWLNSDDLLLPGSLNTVANFFAQNPHVDVVYGHRILINEHDHQIGRWIMPNHNHDVLSWADFIPQETMFWRRSLWEKVGASLDENFKFAMDWDLILRFRKAGAKFVRIPRFLGAFRIHSAQKTSAVISDIGFKEMDILRKREIGYVPGYPEIRKNLLIYILEHIALDYSYRLSRNFKPRKPFMVMA